MSEGIARVFRFHKHIIVYKLEADHFRPVKNADDQISVELITRDNIHHVSSLFSHQKIPVFYEKLEKGCIGVFAKKGPNVVGYVWRRDYNSEKIIKADGYIPLKGRFSHFHFARVKEEMRGNKILTIMACPLIQNAMDRGIHDIYADCERENLASSRAITGTGFREVFRLFVLSSFGRHLSVKYRNSPEERS
jgi:RimJ/RimL family protein N-acetyltransferase